MKFLRKLIKMNRKHTLLKALPLMLAMSFLPLTMSAQKSGMSRAAEKYSQVLYLIDRLYLEDVDFEKLVGEALRLSWLRWESWTRIRPISLPRMPRP